MNSSFRILVVDLSQKKAKPEYFDKKTTWLGGSGLAAGLFEEFGDCQADAYNSKQPLIFTIGPLTGFFPMMSKSVLGFMSPYNGQYAETHAGGRFALALRFAGYDGLVITGCADSMSCLVIGSSLVDFIDVHYLRGMDIFAAGKLLRKIKPLNPGHRSILRIGIAGEKKEAIAGINVDTYRHFGRLGAGAIMGAKNLKAIVVSGDRHLDLEQANLKEYKAIYNEVYSIITKTTSVKKYHDLGTAQNLIPLNELKAIPWRNLQGTSDQRIDSISGENFAENLLLRKIACAGCPVGCVHIGLLRERFGLEHEFLYRQVSYDYEPIFAVGTMLGITNAPDVLTLMEDVERMGLDIISTGVALAWATEAMQKGILSNKHTLVQLKFGEKEGYRKAIRYLANLENKFYRFLSQGVMKACEEYGGHDFACVLGQEMAGYATGEAYFVSQALGFRHSHLDSGAYAFDQESQDKDLQKAVDFMLEQERSRILLSSMVGCFFGRNAYTLENISKAINSLGYSFSAQDLDLIAQDIQSKRWELKFRSGFDPESISIPKRYLEVKNWKGEIDPSYLEQLKKAYAQAIRQMGGKER